MKKLLTILTIMLFAFVTVSFNFETKVYKNSSIIYSANESNPFVNDRTTTTKKTNPFVNDNVTTTTKKANSFVPKEEYKGNDENITSDSSEKLTCESLLGPDVQKVLSNLLKMIQYLGPILVAVFTIIDLIKAFTSGDQGELKKVYPKFIKRVVAAALLFFLPLLVSLIFEATGVTAPNTCFK